MAVDWVRWLTSPDFNTYRLHVEIHRTRLGCCCLDPLNIIKCPGCPQHSPEDSTNAD